MYRGVFMVSRKLHFLCHRAQQALMRAAAENPRLKRLLFPYIVQFSVAATFLFEIGMAAAAKASDKR